MTTNYFKNLFLSLIILSGNQLLASADCSPVNASKPRPLAKWMMGKAREVLVCQLNEFKKLNSDEFEGWINVYQTAGNRLMPFIVEVNSELESEFYSFRVKRLGPKKILITRLLKSTHEGAGGESFAATAATLTCDKECKVSKEKCLGQGHSKVDHVSVKAVLDVKNGKQKVSDLGYYDVLLRKVVESALSGDKEALKLILENTSLKLKADGSAAEVFEDGQQMVQHLVKLGCVSK